ncbi:MAG: nucleotidyltransferase domain-containing protein [Victivallales bacterium]|jgi:predicted nucleotidyltransferase|nr:nucleotidyltransferase domain-containing protein [Victivallales bacterium]
MLQKLLGSQARAEILKNLFTQEHKSIHLRELSRLSGLSAPVLQRELRQLEALGIVTIQKDGNRVKFSANDDNLLYPLLCELVLKTEGPAGILKDAFADSPAIFVFIFGSTANGTAHAGSDIDLFVIGDCGLRDVTKRIHAAAGKIGQEINPYVISQNDFTERLHKQDHFLNEIISTPKIFLKGDADEFARLAE